MGLAILWRIANTRQRVPLYSSLLGFSLRLWLSRLAIQGGRVLRGTVGMGAIYGIIHPLHGRPAVAM